MTSLIQVPAGIYSDGAIQVKAETITPLESTISPYLPRNIKMILGGDNWMISGTGDIGADISLKATINPLDPSIAETEVDVYGDFQLSIPEASLVMGQAYYIHMSKTFQTYLGIFIPNPPVAVYQLSGSTVSVAITIIFGEAYQYTTDGGIAWIDVGSSFVVPNGIYTQGSIQVRTVTDDLPSPPLIMGDIISPYVPIITSVSLQGTSYDIEGIGQIGAQISSNSVITTVDEYGYFQLLISTDPPLTEADVVMSLDTLISPPVTISLPELPTATQVYLTYSMQPDTLMVEVYNYDPADTVELIRGATTIDVPLNSGHRAVVLTGTLTGYHLFINGDDQGVIEVPPGIEINAPAYVAQGENFVIETVLPQGTPIGTIVLTEGWNPVIATKVASSMAATNTVIITYTTGPSGEIPTSAYVYYVRAISRYNTRSLQQSLNILNNITPKNIYPTWDSDGNLTLYMTQAPLAITGHSLNLTFTSVTSTPPISVTIPAITAPDTYSGNILNLSVVRMDIFATTFQSQIAAAVPAGTYEVTQMNLHAHVVLSTLVLPTTYDADIVMTDLSMTVIG